MDTRLILDEIKGKLPRGKVGKATLAELQSRLDSLTDSQRSEAFLRIQDAKLKTPIIVDVCNFFFGNFGVGRFMIGDIGLGIGRLIYSIIAVIFSIILEGEGEEAQMFGLMLVVFMWGWWLVDLVLVLKKVRMQNLRKVLLAIDSVKK